MASLRTTPKAEDLAAGARGLTPYITVRDAAAAISFYVNAFDAQELFRLVDPQSGKIGHAQLRIGTGLLMVSDEYPDFGAVAPDRLGGVPMKLHLDVANADAVVSKAAENGATVLRKVAPQFHGCRQALIADPFGYSWFISEQVDEVAPAEMQRRWDAMGRA